ncbi:MAG: aspartyl protease family protein [Burkholderiales bacterium]
MPSKLLRVLALALPFASIASFGGLAVAQIGGAPPPDPAQILARAKAASGGSAWDALRTQHSKVSILAGPLTGSAERWSEFTTGRSAIVYNMGPVSGAAGFDGKNPWSQDASGKTWTETSDAAREIAANAAYRDRLAFFYPERAPARIAYKERAESDGAWFDVIRITPEGGRPFELWINTETSLIERLVEREAPSTRTEYYSDVRDVAGVKIPFRVRASRSDARNDEFVTVESMEFNVPVPATRFAQPAPPAPDFAFPAGRSTVEVPFEMLGGHLFVKVTLNGKGPFRMLFDSGSSSVLLPSTVAAIGAATGEGNVGVTRVDRVDMGGVLFERQAFATADIAEFLRRVEGLPDIAGVIGYEVFARMPVTLDYERARATLHDPGKFRYAGGGVRVPLEMRGQQAGVQGRVDGIPGLFLVNTGNRGSLTLTQAFTEEHGLRERLSSRVVAVYGAGVGGPLTATLARVRRLDLGEVAIDDPVTMLSLRDAGALAERDVAGSVGNALLMRYAVTFDVPGAALYFESTPRSAERDSWDRSGLWIEQADKGFEVIHVVEGSPAAAAGLRAGDVIVAVDGRPWAGVRLSALRSDLAGAPGRKVRLRMAGGSERVVVLRDLI